MAQGSENLRHDLRFIINQVILPQFHPQAEAVFGIRVFIPAGFGDDADFAEVFTFEGSVSQHEFTVVKSFIGQIAIPKAVAVEFTGGEEDIGAEQGFAFIGLEGFHAAGGEEVESEDRGGHQQDDGQGK